MVASLSNTAKNGGSQLAPGVPVRAGQILSGRYRVDELLGCSATAVVVTARHIHLQEPVTIKILTAYTDDQLDLVKRQIKKARIASRLRGEHVARIKDIGTTPDGMPYIVTERLEGRTLASELERRGGKLPIEEALRLVLQACEGLAEAHSVGLVHGNLKTKNLFLTNDGVLEILDFGMASPIEAGGDAGATAYFGMPSYLAPEQIRDPASVDARADIWALGVILHELIGGALPFSADTVSGVLVAVCFDAPPLLGEAPYELAMLVHRCLEKDAEKRPASVADLAEALASFLGPAEKRTSERIRTELAPRAIEELDDDDDSIAPMSIPKPLQRTVPSQRVLEARQLRMSLQAANARRARVRTIALGTIVAATAIAAAAIIVSPPATPARISTLAPGSDDEVVIPSTRDPFDVPPVVPSSFDVVPTTAVAPPLPPPPPPLPVPVHAFAPRPRVLAPPPPRLPPGLPTTRDGYVRSLFGERK